MPDPNDETIKTYSEKFKTYEEKTPPEQSGEFKEWIDAFSALLPSHARVLEIGAGFGRDTRYLQSKGFSVLATDAVPQALERLKRDSLETDFYDFRDPLKDSWEHAFDGVLANAVFLHAKPETLKARLQEIPQVLKENGIVALSFKKGEGEEMNSVKLGAPRYFRYYSEDELAEIISTTGLELVRTGTGSATNYSPHGWLHLILKVKNS